MFEAWLKKNLRKTIKAKIYSYAPILIPIFALTAINTNFIYSKDKDTKVEQKQIVFYEDNKTDNQITYYYKEVSKQINFINCFEIDSNSDYFFYNDETIKSFEKGEYISFYKLTKSIRTYFDFDKKEISFNEWNSKLEKFKNESILFLNKLGISFESEDINFKKVGQNLANLYLSKDFENSYSLNTKLLSEIQNSYLKTLNDIYKNNYKSFNEYKTKTNSDNLIEELISNEKFFENVLKDISADNSTFWFLTNSEKEMQNLDYTFYISKVLYLKRMYLEIYFTFWYLDFVKEIVNGNFYNKDNDIEEEIKTALSFDNRYKGIAFLLNNQNTLLLKEYNEFQSSLYKVINANYFLGNAVYLSKKEKLLDVDFETLTIDITNEYDRLDFIGWIYNFDNSNFKLWFDYMNNKNNDKIDTFWEKVFSNESSRKDKLLQIYLTNNLTFKTKESGFEALKTKMIDTFSLDYWWENRKEK